ncbi:hypothetical protein ZYGR_0S01040 [Zygosaccharomyces rouxii]|uniref:ZYRO0F04796p n=2 Tax=Zygosaccharomyces rouxii TaxID=4956 RepID=C5DXG2_ZYGRC|nr:uncharacterized protein ZYRO0F04796g [Zygosaccharomyces rouxii]KAH9199234.1 sulfate transporter family-domain-containing protein [Zygosaccharomyces rouxii]GAV49971.1 hypothetical protein ZYGR_0S01040 [Zygosaccharomyces rouxii]CAR28473.1 ZYRO0F04796p [Zygosaccharomyces rouxii]
MSPSSSSLLRDGPHSSERDYGSNGCTSCGPKPNRCPCQRDSLQSCKSFRPLVPITESSVSSPLNSVNHKKLSPNEIEIRPSIWDVLPYYLPFFSWLPNYNISKCIGDLIAGVSLASFQIPLALSFATSVAHVEPLCGLYSLAFTPFIYAILGSVPQMIVGPESAISLVVGQAVEKMISHNPDLHTLQLSAVITFISGGFLFFFGLCRLGFLGNVLSRALLRGFISSVGLVMIINSMISEFKLDKILKDLPVHYHTPFEKILFLVTYAPNNYHGPTTALSLSCFFILIMTKIIKKKLMPRCRWIVFVPDILLLIIGTIFLSIKYRFKHNYSISTVGDFNTKGLDKLLNPLSAENRGLIPQLLSAGFITAMLGFFESTTASKSLGSSYDLAISSNRELVALGSMNLFSSILGSLPAFGGYGRSKINAFSGAQTVMSGAFMGLLVLLTIKFLLPMIHYIPICVLSVVTTMVGISLLEEAPADLMFHFRCFGYDELLVFTLTVLTTMFYSVEVGICIGCGYSVISIIKHSAKSRIQILARVQGTSRFVNSDDYLKQTNREHANENLELEELEGCLIVKIPEPLTFTNTEDLKERLNRLEKFGSTRVHPGARGRRSRSSTRYVIIDLHGMTHMDSSAAQILLEIVSSYRKRDVRVFLARVTIDARVRERLEKSGVVDLVEDNVPMSATNVNQEIYASSYFLTIEDALTAMEDHESANFSSDLVADNLSLVSPSLTDSGIV